MEKLKEIFNKQNGQAIVLAALVMAVIAGMAAVVIDLGSAYVVKSKLQNAADAAALAAAGDLPDTSSAISTAITYAGKNGMKATTNGVSQSGDTVQVVAPYNGDSSQIKVICTRNVSFTFSRFFGYSSKDVSAMAVAALSGADYSAFNYALFSGNGKVRFTGQGHTIDGDVYGYTGVYLKHAVINGVVEAGNNSFDVPRGTITIPNTTIPMPDLSTLIKTQGTEYTSAEVQQLIKSGATVSGPIYVDGDLTINGRIKGTAVIYASGDISFTEDFTQEPADSVMFYTNGDFTFHGGCGEIYGIFYAPNGGFTNRGGPNGNVYGRIITQDDITDSGSFFSVYSSSNDLNALTTLKKIKLIE